MISGKVPFISWQKSVFYEVNDWSLEPGNGVETNAFDDGGVFGEKHCNDGENENSDTENGENKENDNGGSHFDYSTLKTMINKKHFKICYGFEPSMQGYDQIKQNIKNSKPKVLQLGNNNVSILLKNKTMVTEIGKKHSFLTWVLLKQDPALKEHFLEGIPLFRH